jgi:hypothetical protein
MIWSILSPPIYLHLSFPPWSKLTFSSEEAFRQGGFMKYFLSLFFLSLTISVHAEILQTRINQVIQSDDGNHPHLLLLENGTVAKIPANEKSGEDMLSLINPDEKVELKLDDDRNLISIQTLEEEKLFDLREEPRPRNQKDDYVPTNLTSLDQAKAIFKLENRNHQRASQCYNRAHVWAYEEFKRSGHMGMKLFMFFTKRYIWDYNYGWWFHVTPMTYVNGEAMTLDRTFMKGPVNIKNWTLKFIYSKRDCPIVKKYSDYENHQDVEHCYLIPVSMYYWQPRDIEAFEQTGFEKKSFIKNEVDWAYWEAF